MNCPILKKRTCVVLLLVMVVLLSFSAGCIQNIPAENTTSVTTTPTEATPEPTAVPTIVETTVVPTKTTTPKPVLSENDKIYVKHMENRIDEMYKELERRQTEMRNTVWEIENDPTLHLSRNTIRLLDSAVENGQGYSSAISGIIHDQNVPTKGVNGEFEYWTFTEYGKTVLDKLRSYDEGISQQKKDIVSQKRRVNDFYKEKGLPAPYNLQLI